MLRIKRCSNYDGMSCAMIADFISYVKELLNTKDFLSIAIATGFTTEQFILSLKHADIPFDRIDLYIVDEYVGISHLDQHSCTIDLLQPLGTLSKEFRSIKIFSVNNFREEMKRYHQELIRNGLDICVLGVGDDGHVGFCYPPADINTNEFYQLVKLSNDRKNEHFSKGWFPSINVVPDHVITLSLWGMLHSSIIMVGAMYENKKDVILHMINRDISPYECPILYFIEHNNLMLYIG